MSNRKLTVDKIQLEKVPLLDMVVWFDDPSPHGAEIISIYILNKSQQS